MAQFVALRAAACVGAEYSNLALLSADGNSLRLFHSPFLDAEIAARYTDVPLDAPYPIAVAARDDRVVLLPDLDSYQEEFPGLGCRHDRSRDPGDGLASALPLRRNPSRGDRVRLDRADVFDRKLDAALRAVAILCVETVELAERYDADHDLIVALAEQAARQPSGARGH